jgi:hypothetical protein
MLANNAMEEALQSLAVSADRFMDLLERVEKAVLAHIAEEKKSAERRNPPKNSRFL